MKFWLEAELEKDDYPMCCKCREWQKGEKHVYAEFILRQGGLPNIDELHPEITGRFMCKECRKIALD
jgi:isopentenyl diphosphate isomerase/L-lactate dehydrogenase-like FMN-dependent dehydrogenase